MRRKRPSPSGHVRRVRWRCPCSDRCASPAKLSGEDDQRLVEHAECGQVLRGGWRLSSIGGREQPLLEGLEVSGRVSQVSHATHVDLDDRDAGLNQSSREQKGIGRTCDGRSGRGCAGLLAFQPEARATLPESIKAISDFTLGLERVDSRRGSSPTTSVVDPNWSLPQPFPRRGRGGAGAVRHRTPRERQALDLKVAHALGSCLICQGSCFGPRKPGVLTWPGQRAFHQIGREHDPAWDAVAPRADRVDRRGVTGIVVAREAILSKNAPG